MLNDMEKDVQKKKESFEYMEEFKLTGLEDIKTFKGMILKYIKVQVTKIEHLENENLILRT